MTKRNRWIGLALTLALLCLAVPGLGEQTQPLVMAHLGETMEDFTVTTLTGESFTLSEALKEKEAVLINFWATWCPPCRAEFPYLEQAYQQDREQVAVIALSVEMSDDEDTLRAFAADNGLTFPIARDEGRKLASWAMLEYIPTTLIIDRYGVIAYVGVGAMPDAGSFARLMDAFLGADYTETRLLTAVPPEAQGYTITFVDQFGAPVPGCIVNFCTDTLCTPVTSDENGVALFAGEPGVYHVQVLRVPQGYAVDPTQEYYTRDVWSSMTIQVEKQ